MTGTALLTGFEPYGRRSANPSAKLAAMLDGSRIGDLDVVGRTLPVSLDGLAQRIDTLLHEFAPAVVIALGLWPGEPMIRLERFAVNLADFEISDNAGDRLTDAAIAANGQVALSATLPLRAIERALLAEGIPVRLSNTAGTFLCNATLYHLLHAIEQRGARIPCGFVHLPYLPEQVAEMMSAARAGTLEVNQRADLASMDLSMMEQAIRSTLAVVASHEASRVSR